MRESNSGNTWTKQISKKGEFVRKSTTFRNWIENKPNAQFQPKTGRYHLYVSYACPWAHRTLITRKIKGLDHAISYDVVDSFLGSDGWSLDGNEMDATGDSVNKCALLRDIYKIADADYAGTITVPILWDCETRTIVNNESSEIIRMLNGAFQDIAKCSEVDLYPRDKQEEIDRLNDQIYGAVNNGVYRCGFAQSQKAYDEAVETLFSSLDELEGRLGVQRYLVGDSLTEADIRLFPTLVRFDAVYVTHFKCNVRRIVDYPNLWGYLRDVYQYPGISETINMTHIKHHYYRSHRHINPFGIVPAGPALDFSSPHGRDRLFI